MATSWAEKPSEWTNSSADISSDSDIDKSDSVFVTFDHYSFGHAYVENLDSKFRIMIFGGAGRTE